MLADAEVGHVQWRGPGGLAVQENLGPRRVGGDLQKDGPALEDDGLHVARSIVHLVQDHREEEFPALVAGPREGHPVLAGRQVEGGNDEEVIGVPAHLLGVPGPVGLGGGGPLRLGHGLPVHEELGPLGLDEEVDGARVGHQLEGRLHRGTQLHVYLALLRLVAGARRPKHVEALEHGQGFGHAGPERPSIEGQLKVLGLERERQRARQARPYVLEEPLDLRGLGLGEGILGAELDEAGEVLFGQVYLAHVVLAEPPEFQRPLEEGLVGGLEASALLPTGQRRDERVERGEGLRELVQVEGLLGRSEGFLKGADLLHDHLGADAEGREREKGREEDPPHVPTLPT